MRKLKTLEFLLLCVMGFILAGNVHAWPIPDTGRTTCYNNTEVIPCPSSGEAFYGQDASYIINPPSYTKLDATGNDLSDDATSWVMVKDNVTGLIWEVKTDDSNIHHKDILYTWHDASNVFIAQLIADNFGNYSDWRLPTIEEMRSILCLVGKDYLSNPVSSDADYWSSDTVVYAENKAWTMAFSDADNHQRDKLLEGPVIAVRGEQSVSSFTDNDDGTVTDSRTGLMWIQVSDSGALKWEDALFYSEDLTFANYNDWRLPNIKELGSLTDLNAYQPALDTNYFSNPAFDAGFWSSTAGLLQARYMQHTIGNDYSKDKTYSGLHVRAVRGGQSGTLDHLVILSPKQASLWCIDSIMPIRWETEGLDANVKISLSRQDGIDGSFETVVETTSNDGEYDWTITGPESVNCVIKIERTDDPSVYATEGLFSIRHCYSQKEEFQLIAGDGNKKKPGADVGFISISTDGVHLKITYEIDTGDWEFYETHLHIATSLSSIPRVNKGCPIPGQFAYADPPEADPTSQTYTIPFVDIFGDTPASGTYTLYIAAQADIGYVDEADPLNPVIMEEGAWGADILFPSCKNWSMYMVYTLIIEGE